MVIKNNTADFFSEWKKYENIISNTLKNKYTWKNEDDELWKDIMAEARALCFEKFGQYNKKRATVLTFFLTISEYALLRFLQRYNRTTFGDTRLDKRIKNLELLKEAVINENDARVILAFICRYYLKIKPENFIEHGYINLTLEKLFRLVKEQFIGKFVTKKMPEWYAEYIENIFSLLQKKILPNKNDYFLRNDKNKTQSYSKLAQKLKSSFYTAIVKARTNKDNPGQDDFDNDNDTYQNGDVNPEAAINLSTFKPDEIALMEEYAEKKRDLLLFTIRNTGNPRYLIAFLFNICSITHKKFVENKYHLLTIKALIPIFKYEFFSRTYIARQKLEPAIAEIEQKISPVENEIYCEQEKYLDLADWSHKVKNSIITLIKKRATASSRELYRYFEELYNKRSSDCM